MACHAFYDVVAIFWAHYSVTAGYYILPYLFPPLSLSLIYSLYSGMTDAERQELLEGFNNKR
jgi:hypothetical protein